MATFIKVDGKIFVFDLNKICSFIAEKTGQEMKETEILDTFDYSETPKKLNSKSVRELKTMGNGQETVVYDLIKMFIIQVVAYDNGVDIDLNEMPFGGRLAFNTLMAEGFLKEIE